jgi:hypothetical protein
MRLFDQQLENFIDTIENGPGALVPSLFDGPIDRVLLGLKAHANTVSHARLMALEQTFPRTRNAIGDSEFNALSRAYCATECARSSVPNSIGEGFRQFLQTCLDDAAILDLCRIEWAWLECYHAPDTAALALADLAMIDAKAVLALQIARHPAARMIVLNAQISPELSEFADEMPTPAILITRPANAVILTALTNLDRDIFCSVKISTDIGNLLNLGIEQVDEQAALGSVMKLMGAGALVTTGLKNAEVDPII